MGVSPPPVALDVMLDRCASPASRECLVPSTDEGMQCILVAETKPAVGLFITMMVHLLIPRLFVSAHVESGEAIGY